MAVNEQETVLIGVFSERARADDFVDALKRAGFRDDQLGVLEPDGMEEETESLAEEGATAGALSGVIPGAMAGAVAAGLLPGVGPLISAGILAGTLGGAAVGAAAGGALGALIGYGVPEEHAHHSAAELQAGRTLVVVKPEGRFADALAVLKRVGGRDASPPKETALRIDELDERPGDHLA